MDGGKDGGDGHNNAVGDVGDRRMTTGWRCDARARTRTRTDEGERMNGNLLRRTRTMMPVRTELENEARARDERETEEKEERRTWREMRRGGGEAGRSCGSGTVM